VAAFSRLNYFLFPSVYSEWVYTGDFLRLIFYLLLFAGAAREIAGYQRQLTTAAVLEERRRMARDLHDGLAQELAFISSQSKRLNGPSREEVAELLGQAADRALDESRTVITTLNRPVDADLAEAVGSTISELALRHGVEVDLDLDERATCTPRVSESLARIAGEAVNNAVRHGKARSLHVTLRQQDDLCLVIRDDGSGFDAEAADGGFGMRSMRERAEAVGGRLRVASVPGEGAEVEVRIR
jgi:signal transduction histidine kinase